MRAYTSFMLIREHLLKAAASRITYAAYEYADITTNPLTFSISAASSAEWQMVCWY